jgi:inner membrane transporter RhtA
MPTGGGSIDGLGVGMVFGAIAIAPFGAAGLEPAFDRPWLLFLGATVGLLSNVVPYSLDQVTMPRLPQERFALMFALLPAVATFLGWLLLDQVPSGRQAVGTVLIVAAIALRDRSGEGTSADPTTEILG